MIPHFKRPPRPLALALSAAASLLVSACGGGGGAADAIGTSAQPAELAAPAASQAPLTVAPLPATAATLDTPATPDEQLAQAMLATDTLAAANVASAPAQTTISRAEEVHAVALAVPPAAAIEITRSSLANTASAAKTYYVDSKLGNDSFNGLAATAASGGNGPWRTLAKVNATALAAGESVRLLCGGVWNETLKLSASGTASLPITLTSHPANCSDKPLINGGATIAAAQWTVHNGSIYKASLATAPLQVLSTAGGLTQAHHPNKGHDSTLPESLYLRLAANSDNVLVNKAQTSSYLLTGADLKLPAGTTITPGTVVRVRSNSWAIDESKVSAVSGTKLSLATRTAYPLTTGWGYYLLGQLWMLDSAGEWHYDDAGKALYLWMPDSRPPGATVAATLLPIGIDLQGVQNVTVDNLAIKMVGTGINLQSSTGVTIRNMRIDDASEHGADAAGSVQATLEANTLTRVGLDGITGHNDVLPAANGLRAINNNLSEIGVVMAGDTVASLPRRSRAAIRAGGNAIITGNSINNTGYIGIWPRANSTVTNNYISGACAVLDDCGAIYVSGVNNNGTISGNLVQNSRGAVAGKAPQFAYTQAQGIYLDESASGVTVSGNTVVGADNGVQIHVAAGNVIKDNKLYGNRNSQIWLQETRNTDNPLGDVFGNTVTGNQIVPTVASARGVFLETQILDTSRFGAFNFNRYFDRIFSTVAEERTNASRSTYTIGQWKSATTAAGVSRSLDPNGSGTSETRFAAVRINGSNLVPNASLSTDAKGWTSWNLTSPFGYLVREACTPGWCARYVTGGSMGILSSPNFSVVAGTWYRLSVDLATGTNKQLVNLVLRRGGGGTNGYESVSDRSLKVTAGTAWQRYSVIFKATKTINAADPITKDLGARVDAQNIEPGQVVSMANLEVAAITPADALTRNDILVNSGSGPLELACPVASTQAAMCANYVLLSNNLPVSWPFYLAGRSAEIVYTLDASLVDTDGDGIPDSQDRCANTSIGAGVNSRGCALGQI